MNKHLLSVGVVTFLLSAAQCNQAPTMQAPTMSCDNQGFCQDPNLPQGVTLRYSPKPSHSNREDLVFIAAGNLASPNTDTSVIIHDHRLADPALHLNVAFILHTLAPGSLAVEKDLNISFGRSSQGQDSFAGGFFVVGHPELDRSYPGPFRTLPGSTVERQGKEALDLAEALLQHFRTQGTLALDPDLAARLQHYLSTDLPSIQTSL